MDRRVKRTRTAVFNAAIDLLIEKETNKITVLELCKKADINKSTFYLHFKSIEDCLENCFEVIMNGIVELSKTIQYYQIENHPEELVPKMINEVEKNIDYICKFKNSNICAPSIRMFKKNLVTAVCEHNNFTLENNYKEVMTITYNVAGCVDALLEALPTFDKEKLTTVLVFQLKKR